MPSLSLGGGLGASFPSEVINKNVGGRGGVATPVETMLDRNGGGHFPSHLEGASIGKAL